MSPVSLRGLALLTPPAASLEQPARCPPWGSQPGVQGAELGGFTLYHVTPCAMCDSLRILEAPSSPPPDSQPEQPQGRGQRRAPPL